MNKDSHLIKKNDTLQMERRGGVSNDLRDAMLRRGRKRFETLEFSKCQRKDF